MEMNSQQGLLVVRTNKGFLKPVSRKKAAPWIFAHYQKIYNFYPILMKLGGNDHLMG